MTRTKTRTRTTRTRTTPTEAPEPERVLDASDARIGVETFEPDYCAWVIDNRNRNIRKLRPTKAAQYAADMAAGKWAVGLSVIGFDTDDWLVDGQHRFAAAIMADVPFSSVVARGVTTDAVDNADRGFKRSVADILRVRGEVSVTALQAGLNFAYRWDYFGPLSAATPTWSQLETYLAEHPDLRTAVVMAAPLHKPPLAIRSIVIAFIHRALQINTAATTEFVHALHTGIGLERDDPILRLRENFLPRRIHTYGRPTREHDLAIIIKAWNAYITNRKLRNLKWNRGGGRQESFPALLGPDGNPWPFPDVLRDQARRDAAAEKHRATDD